ncbi:MAG: hypothetical protein IJ442_06055, partial [Bacteroidaceae bacterium]|nr:hypothetical protein [Bacteroidaceae bacterium]
IAVGRSLGLRAPAAWQSRGVFHNIISLLTRKTLRFYLDSSAILATCRKDIAISESCAVLATSYAEHSYLEVSCTPHFYF